MRNQHQLESPERAGQPAQRSLSEQPRESSSEGDFNLHPKLPPCSVIAFNGFVARGFQLTAVVGVEREWRNFGYIHLEGAGAAVRA